MTVHIPHPDSHAHGLCDDCPRCAEHAADPVNSLDETNLRRLLELSFDHEARFASSYNDQVAVANLLNIIERAGHIGRVAPDLFTMHMLRFGVECYA